MRKAIMLSINPKWCGLIASKKKTLEIRKSKPKLEVPFRAYIYCTKGRGLHFWRSKTYAYADNRSHNVFDICGDGKIIGEFTCDRVYQYSTANIDGVNIAENDVVSQSCLSRKALEEYENSAEPKENCIYLMGLYCWHISDLVIYDKPKTLYHFRKALECHRGNYKDDCVACWDCQIKRAPQSWCYVEELKGGAE